MTGEVVGVIPAAGSGTRLGPLPFSKEIFPLRFGTGLDGAPRPTVAAEFLLDGFRRGGADRAYVVLRQGKWDIPAHLGDGQALGIPVGYLMMRLPHGQPFTVAAAHPFLGGATVLFGFPDIVFQPEDAFLRLRERQSESGADLVLGLFPAPDPEGADMVELDARGGVRAIAIKPGRTELRYTWILAAWTSEFTDFLHRYVIGRSSRGEVPAGPGGRELYMGDVIQAALEEGMAVDAVRFDDGTFVDIGTPEGLRAALRSELGGDR